MADTNKAAQPGAAKKPEEEKKQEKPVVEELVSRPTKRML